MSIALKLMSQHTVHESIKNIKTYHDTASPYALNALREMNTKCEQLITHIKNHESVKGGILSESLTNLNSALEWCQSRLSEMKVNKVTRTPSSFLSVEFSVTGLNPDRPIKTLTIHENVKTFEQELQKTQKLRDVIRTIVQTSNWPQYKDIEVCSNQEGYSILKKPTYAQIEYMGVRCVCATVIMLACFVTLFVHFQLSENKLSKV